MPFFEAVSKLPLPRLEHNLFSSPSWMAVLHKTYEVELFVKYIELNNKIRSYVIYSVVRNFLEEKVCVCSYCDYCDCPVSGAGDWHLFFQSWRDDLPNYRIAIRNLRDPFVRQCKDFKFLYHEMYHVLDTSDPLELLWKHAHDSFKAAVNQARRKGVKVVRCQKSELKKFYELHLRVRKNKYRIFPQPYRFFENIWNEYMDSGRGVLLGAYDKSGRFIGGNVYLICGNTLFYKFNTSALDALDLRPNNILFWEGIVYAKERNLGALDLGSSGYEQTGLIRFKDHTGASSQLIYHLGFAPKNYVFSKKRILKFLTNNLTARWMPNAVLKWGSDIIYHNLA